MNTKISIRTSIKPVTAAIALAIAPGVALTAPDDINLNFGNTTSALVNGVDFVSTCNTTQDMLAGREFWMCDPSGNLGGGLPNKKDTINGTEVWSFDSSTGQMSSVTNTGVTGGVDSTIAAAIDSGSMLPTADRDGGPAIDQGAEFFSNIFGFLAPFTGSQAATSGSPHPNDTGYGNPTIAFDIVNNEVSVFFPVLEAQWAGTHFPLGLTGNAGITMKGPITNVVINNGGSGFTSFDYRISGEHTITGEEDPGSAGFGGWSPLWVMVGSGTAPDFLFNPPNPPTSSVGVIGPTPGGPGDGNIYNDGRITLAESVAAFGEDTGADLGQDVEFSDPCNGSCFDFTVTGLTGAANETVQIVLPLTSPIQANAVYRKYNNALGWHNFDVSAGDTVESGAGAGKPVDCSGATFTPGLTAGHDCVRLTILNGGPNDNDGALDTTLVDPGGVASAFVPVDNTIPGQSIGDAEGCSMSSRPVSPLERTDWWVIAAFLTALGLRKYRRVKA